MVAPTISNDKRRRRSECGHDRAIAHRQRVRADGIRIRQGQDAVTIRQPHVTGKTIGALENEIPTTHLRQRTGTGNITRQHDGTETRTTKCSVGRKTDGIADDEHPAALLINTRRVNPGKG